VLVLAGCSVTPEKLTCDDNSDCARSQRCDSVSLECTPIPKCFSAVERRDVRRARSRMWRVGETVRRGNHGDSRRCPVTRFRRHPDRLHHVSQGIVFWSADDNVGAPAVEISNVPPTAQVSFSINNFAPNGLFAITVDRGLIGSTPFDPVAMRGGAFAPSRIGPTESPSNGSSPRRLPIAWARRGASLPVTYSGPDGNAAIYTLETTRATTEPVEVASAFTCPDGTR
jgi:hypothetical protein